MAVGVDDAPFSDMPGAQRVGPYRVLRHLGVGGMGTLSLATRIDGDGTVVVLKRPLSGRSTPQTMALARREAAIAASLDHPGIVGVLEVIDDAGVPVLVMEHLLGLTVLEVGRRARLAGAIPLEPLLDAVAQAARALHHLHTRTDDQGRRRGLVHRDVSPDNLFITTDGVVKLLDFGVARADDLDGLTQVGGLRGKRGYFAPELVQGQPADARSDLFALGITFYGLLCGQLPWGRLDPGPAFVAMMDAAAPPPSLVNPLLPPAIDRLVLKLLSVDRDARFADGAAVADHIDALLSQVPSSVRDAARLIERFGDVTPVEATVILPVDDRDADDRDADDRDADDGDADWNREEASRERTRPIQRWDDHGASASKDEDSTAAFLRPRPAAPRVLQVLGLDAVQLPVRRALAPSTSTTLLRPVTIAGGAESLPSGPRDTRAPASPRSSGGGALGLVLGGLLGLVVLVAVGSRLIASDRSGPDAPPPPSPSPSPSSPPSSPPSPPSSPPSSPSSPSPSPLPEPSTRTVKRPPLRIGVQGPARVQWRLNGRLLMIGPGSVDVPSGTRALQAREPQRGVVVVVPIVDDVADWDALPSVQLLLRARPWATVKLGDELLGQTPLQPVSVVPGRYVVRFERPGQVVTRTVDVRAGVGTVKVNVDMEADADR